MRKTLLILTTVFLWLNINAQYTLTSSDVTITDNGFITHCSYNFAQKSIIIPEKIGGVTVIGIGDDNLFGGVFQAKGITALQLPSTLKTIGRATFKDNLITSLTVPEGVTHIGQSAFSDCSITTLDLPSSLIYMGQQAFYSNAITSLVIPASLKYLDTDVFYYNNISNLVLHDSVTYIGYGAFSHNQIKKLVLPPSVNYIGGIAFWDNAIDTLELSGNVRFIGNQSFAENYLTFLNIPEGVEIIGAYAFEYNDIDSLVIPSTVTEIWGRAFEGCPLGKVYYNEVSKLNTVERGAYNTGDNIFHVALPDTVAIEGYTFGGWHDNYGDAVADVDDEYNSYYAKGTQTGFLVSGTTNLDGSEEMLLYVDGDFSQTVMAESDGTYQFRVNPGRSITITPFKRGYAFTPQSITLSNIQTDMPNQDFNFTELNLGYVIATPTEGYHAETVSVYPNPATAVIYINMDEADGSHYKITDITGKLVQTGLLSQHGSVDVNALSNGLYFLTITAKGNTHYRSRFIKQ